MARVRDEARLWAIATGCAIVAALGFLLPVMVDEKPFVVVGVSAFPCGTFAAFLTGRTAVRRRRLWRGGLETRRFRLGSAIDLSPHSRLLMAPLLLCCGGIVVAAGTFISISGDPYSSLREAKLFWYGLAGVLVAAGTACGPSWRYEDSGG